MKTKEQREVKYIVQDSYLVRTVRRGDATSYTHRCPKETFQKVAHSLAETPAEGLGTCLGDIAMSEQLPFTQVNVALEYMKERGLVEIRRRRCYPATADTYLDAMIEFSALAEGG
jgi:hypothetical protein